MDPKDAASIADQLRDDIRSGRLAAGSVLHQEALAARFGVSRQPIRLAIEVLRASGLVAVRRARSVEVLGMSAEALRDLLAVRLLAEKEALSHAIPQRTERDILEARHLQARLEKETEPRLLEELDCAFHSALYKPCGNTRLLKLIEDLRREDRRPYAEQPTGSAKRATWTKQHRVLLRKYADGDAAGAATVLEEHLAELTRR